MATLKSIHPRLEVVIPVEELEALNEHIFQLLATYGGGTNEGTAHFALSEMQFCQNIKGALCTGIDWLCEVTTTTDKY